MANKELFPRCEQLHQDFYFSQPFQNFTIKVYFNNNQTPYRKILDLIQESYNERVLQGLNFTCSSYTLDEFCEHVANSIIITIENSEGLLLGTVTLTPLKKYGHKYAYHKHLAVSSHFKKQGIGSILERFVEEIAHTYNIDFITSSTATEAISSVKFHERNGFKKRKYVSYECTNYDSYEFIKVIQWTPLVFVLMISRIPCYFATRLKTVIKKIQFLPKVGRNKL